MAAAVHEYDHEEEEEEKPVYVLALKKDLLEFDWYKLDLKKGKGSVLKMDWPQLDYYAECPAVVSLGSSIYLLGGFPRQDQSQYPDSVKHCDDVYCLDTRHPQDGWKKAAPMLCGDCGSSVVALGGKLYVLSEIPQVFDPMSGDNGCWFPMEAKPPHNWFCYGATPVISDSSKGRFLAYFDDAPDSIYSYCLESQRWDCLFKDEQLFYFDWVSDASVVVDDVVYFYQFASVLAYDLVNKIWLDTTWAKPFTFVPVSGDVLLHLGNGILCLARHYSGTDENTFVHCIKFRVQKTGAGVVSMTALFDNSLTLEDVATVSSLCR